MIVMLVWEYLSRDVSWQNYNLHLCFSLGEFQWHQCYRYKNSRTEKRINSLFRFSSFFLFFSIYHYFFYLFTSFCLISLLIISFFLELCRSTQSIIFFFLLLCILYPYKELSLSSSCDADSMDSLNSLLPSVPIGHHSQ